MGILLNKLRWLGRRWLVSTKPGILSAWPLLLPALLLLPGLTAFPYSDAQARFSDLALTHYPNALFLQHAIAKWGGIPLWSPAILSGAPLAANPLSGLWYPPGWIALLLPLPLGFNLMVVLHLIWGGAGMLRLLESEGLRREAALFGALAFEMLPKLFAHYGAGHLTLLYAIPWTPWLLYWQGASLRDLRLAPRWGLNGPALLPAIALGLIFLADPRWAAYAGGAWLAYSLWLCWRLPLSLLTAGRVGFQQAVLALLFSAPLALPLLEYTRLSTRSLMGMDDFFAYSFPVSRVLGFMFPDFGGFHEWMGYSGAVVLLLALVCISAPSIRKNAGFWLALALVSLVYSFGSQIPFLAGISRIPGVNLLRVPSRALFLTGLALAAAAAYGMDRILRGMARDERKPIRLALAALAIFSLLLAVAVMAVTKKAAGNFLWGASLTVLAAAVILWALSGKAEKTRVYPVLLLLCLVDLGGVDRTLFFSRKAEDVLSEQKEVAELLAKSPGYFRVYSPSYSLPQQTAASYGLQLADGVDPLQLSAYAGFMEKATGAPVKGYSVTLPSFASGEPATDNERYQPDVTLLGLLNVRYVAAEYDLHVEGLAPVAQIGNTRVYENLQTKPRAWVRAGENGVVDSAAAEIVAWSPNAMVVNAKGPGLLVLSEIEYPGWRAWIDGVETQILPYEGILRSISLTGGEHRVKLLFRPTSVYAGLFCFVVGLVWAWRRGWRTSQIK